MRLIATGLSLISVGLLVMTMFAGLRTAHDQTLFLGHLQWSMVTFFVVMLTLALCLMFVFKMHSIIHDLVRQLDGRGDHT